MIAGSYLPLILATGSFLGQAFAQNLRGNIRLYTTNNQCDGSDGLFQCGDTTPGTCCSVGATSFILSTNTQITSSPGGGATTHIITAAQNGNLCAITLNSDPACARTSQSDTAQGGTWAWQPFTRMASRDTERSAGEDCLSPDTFQITDGEKTYSASTAGDGTIEHLLSLARAEQLEWAKAHGKVI